MTNYVDLGINFLCFPPPDTDSSRAASSSEDVGGSHDSNREQRSRRRPRWLALECEDPDLPLNTTLLDVLLSDVMGHSDSWPFLRPVQKHEVWHLNCDL